MTQTNAADPCTLYSKLLLGEMDLKWWVSDHIIMQTRREGMSSTKQHNGYKTHRGTGSLHCSVQGSWGPGSLPGQRTITLVLQTKSPNPTANVNIVASCQVAAWIPRAAEPPKADATADQALPSACWSQPSCLPRSCGLNVANSSTKAGYVSTAACSTSW